MTRQQRKDWSRCTDVWGVSMKGERMDTCTTMVLTDCEEPYLAE